MSSLFRSAHKDECKMGNSSLSQRTFASFIRETILLNSIKFGNGRHNQNMFE